MRTPDEGKRASIIAAAGKLFSERPFHKVLLTEVAAEAGVGKGTLYLYFKDKAALYAAVVHDRFKDSIDRVEERLRDNDESPEHQLRVIIDSFVRLNHDNPDFIRLAREGALCPVDPNRSRKLGQRLVAMVEGVLQRGIEQGCFTDPHPHLTARMIKGMPRAVYVYGDIVEDPDDVAEHIMRVALAALKGPAA